MPLDPTKLAQVVDKADSITKRLDALSARRVNRVADKAQNFSGVYILTNLHPHSARPHMRIKDVLLWRDLDDDVIAGGIGCTNNNCIFA